MASEIQYKLDQKEHKFHLVDPSPWPLFGSLAVFVSFTGLLFFMHDKAIGNFLMPVGVLLVLATMYYWWKDVVKEAIQDKAHSRPVKKGLKLGMSLFILSEVMFFFAFFFAYFYSALLPVDILGELWPEKAGVWPPESIKTLDAWSIPFLNTLILLLSGTTVTWAHYAVLNNNNKDVVRALKYTVILGIIFTCFQAYEYVHALHHNFGFTGNIYSSNFYMATGFHGFHVIVGTLFLIVCYFRAKKGQFDSENHLGFEFAAWYWHFVDVVWLFLFAFVYVWGA